MADDDAVHLQSLEHPGDRLTVLVVHLVGETARPDRAVLALDPVGLGGLAEQPLAGLGVDPVETVLHVHEIDAPVHEQAPTHDHRHRPVGETARIGTARAERRHPGPLVRFMGGQGGVEVAHGHRIHEVGETSGGDIAEIEGHVHQLVVPVEHVQGAARRPGRVGQDFQPVQDLLLLVAAVELVSGLHHDQVAADPVPVLVDGPGQAESLGRRPQVPVEIPQGHDAWGGGMAGRWACRIGDGRGGERDSRGDRQEDPGGCIHSRTLLPEPEG